MGVTGAGKSTFINDVTGRDSTVVGKREIIDPCTSEINAVPINDPQLLSSFNWLEGRSLILVDTPGFDNPDDSLDDTKILEGIAQWLKPSYSSRLLAGVVYLHDISADRYTGTARKNLTAFRNLCGQKTLAMVAIGATKAEKAGKCAAIERFEQLKNSHWNGMIKYGAYATLLGVDGQGSKQVIEKLLHGFGKKMGNRSK